MVSPPHLKYTNVILKLPWHIYCNMKKNIVKCLIPTLFKYRQTWYFNYDSTLNSQRIVNLYKIAVTFTIERGKLCRLPFFDGWRNKKKTCPKNRVRLNVKQEFLRFIQKRYTIWTLKTEKASYTIGLWLLKKILGFWVLCVCHSATPAIFRPGYSNGRIPWPQCL